MRADALQSFGSPLLANGELARWVAAAERRRLTPILLTGLGRSGSTAMMSLLGTDSRVVMDAEYPHENCHLTYLLKLALIQDRQALGPQAQGNLIDFDETILGPYPRGGALGFAEESSHLRSPDWLPHLWCMIEDRLEAGRGKARFYAEKVPPWVSANVRKVIPCLTIYLFRDPRDIYLSSNAFMRKRGFLSFGRTPEDSEWSFAHTVAHGYLGLYENYRSDRSRQDCLMVRYEDFVGNLSHTVDQIQKPTGLRLAPELLPERLEFHATSKSIESSVSRWQIEDVPSRIIEFLDRQLHEPLEDLVYAVRNLEPASLARQIEGSWLAQNVSSLAISPDGGLSLHDGESCRVTLTGEDFYLHLPFEPIQAEEISEIWVCLQGATGNHNSIYWRGQTEEFSEDRRLHLPFHPAAHWQVIRFRLHPHSHWRGRISELRLDLFNGPVNPKANEGRLRWIRLVE